MRTSVDPKTWPEARSYFSDYAKGRFHESAQLQYIYPIDGVHESGDGTALFIGRAGANSIEFAFRKGYPGIWAWHPMEKRWDRIADDLPSFHKGWLDGSVTV